ncbi:hypothetical protein C5T94_29200, partial [Raoultella ornithinolytica]
VQKGQRKGPGVTLPRRGGGGGGGRDEYNACVILTHHYPSLFIRAAKAARSNNQCLAILVVFIKRCGWVHYRAIVIAKVATNIWLFKVYAVVNFQSLPLFRCFWQEMIIPLR